MRSSSLTEQDKQTIEDEAKIIVCETGISMYEFRKRFQDRYETAIGNTALHEAIDQGIKQDWLQRGKPKNYPHEGLPEQHNIVLTPKGFERIREKGFEEVIIMEHILYAAKITGGLR